MKRNILIAAAIAALLCPSWSITLSAQNGRSGDEQGMEADNSATFANRKALEDALNGWWKDAEATKAERMAWYNEAKFGCFVHWGVYADAAGTWKGKRLQGYSEHLMRREKITVDEYTSTLIRNFEARDFDADEWMRLASEAGMRYFIITAKHHDGFAMFPSDAYPYDIRMTRMQRDPMAELAAAARKYGIKFGFYYSHAFDWEHPLAPGNDWMYDNPGGDKLLHGGAEWWLSYPEFLPSARKYVDEKCLPQLKELVDNYHPDILWFDTPHKLPFSENMRILQYLREIAPDVVINGRLARDGHGSYGDYINTGDRAAYFFPTKGAWEAIPTTNESYGYNENDKSHKPASHFIRLLASATAKGGNILMNIGPKGDGTIDVIDQEILRGVGRWMKTSGESIYGATATGLPTQSWGETTAKGDNIYFHVFDVPASGKIVVNGLKGVSLKDARFLSGGAKVDCRQISADEWQLTLPVKPGTIVDTVVVARKAGSIVPTSQRLLQPGMKNVLLTFDAELTGCNFGHGDGKTLRNYVNWKSPEGRVSWNVRNSAPMNGMLSLEFTGNGKGSGEMVLDIDGTEYPFVYEDCAASKSAVHDFGMVKLPAGDHVISLRGISFTGSEFMRPLNLTLTPAAIVPDATCTYAQKDGDELKLDFYKATGCTEFSNGKRKPAVLFVFGGGFMSGTRDSKFFSKWFEQLTSNGYSVFSIDYRLGLKGVTKMGVMQNAVLEKAIHMAVEDLYDATNYIIDNAERFDVDPAGIVLAGSSAGAITIMQAEWELCSGKQRAKVLPEGFNYAGVMSFAGAVFSREGKIDYDITPCPTLLLHGTADKLVNYNQIKVLNIGFFGSNKLLPRLAKAGCNYRIYRYEGNSHEIASVMPKTLGIQLDFLETCIGKGQHSTMDVSLSDPNIPAGKNIGKKDLYNKDNK